MKPERRAIHGGLSLLMLVALLFCRPMDLLAGQASAGITPTAETTSPPVIREVKVVIQDHPQRQATFQTIARSLIGLKAGDALTEKGIQASVEALKLSRRFAAIHVDTISAAQGESLVFTLTPYHYVADIRIHGNSPLFDQDVLNVMTLYPGAPYNREKISAQVAPIANRFKRAGYIDPQVTIERKGNGADDQDVLIVRIEKGQAYQLGTLSFNGNQGLSDAKLKWHMTVWRNTLLPGGDRFSSYQLKKDIDRLLAYYREKGFLNAKLAYKTRVADDGRHVDVAIDIDEGPDSDVSLEGNRRFWDRTLNKDIVLFKTGNRGNIGVRKSIQNMLRRYRAAGYLNTRIQSETQPVPGSAIARQKIRFIIQEGPESVVQDLSVTGNHALSTEAIKEDVLTRPPSLFHDGAFVPETLEEDVFAVTTRYMQQGFQDRTVDPEVTFNGDKTRVDVKLAIDEGPRTTVGRITIQGLVDMPEETARKALIQHPGGPFRQAALDADKEAIISLVAEKGYPHATVDSQVGFSDDRTRADIVYRVTPGPKVTLGDVFIAGNLRTRERVIRRELNVTPGAPLSLRGLYDGQRQLRNMDIFQSVDFRTIGLKERDETVDLFVDIREKPPYYLQSGVGYKSDSGLYGRVSAGNRNILGLDIASALSGTLSQTGYRLDAELTEPRFLWSRTRASLSGYAEEKIEFNQPFGTRTTGGALAFNRNWNDHLASVLSFNLEKRDQFSVDTHPTDETEESTRTIFVTSPSLRYDNRDSFIRPTRGFFSSASVDISKGIQYAIDDFVRYQLDNRFYYSPFERVTLAGLVRFGQIIPYGASSQVPDDQLFFLGGIQDVRGYGENLLRVNDAGDPVGGKTAVVGSLELRLDLGMNLELTTFYDIGSVQDALVDAGSDNFRASVGLGLRYITPIGPMGLLYGYKLDRNPDESADCWHVSIGYSF
ncbi:outer membrane protein assembly factor BamA [Desulfosarcina cetonica]|uniref:outer membrane protein assembly factor BamA n=1 Tax=Desulfosarcina cetonica TaxID=90730 RepID=UPI00155D8D9B|nr:outer membrane protein assembly factor BamA [Desulfosarcina cetonica]